MTGNPWADLYWYRCTGQLRGELSSLGHGGYRECYEMPRAMDGDGEPGAHLHGVPMHIAADIDQIRTEAAIDAAASALTGGESGG